VNTPFLVVRGLSKQFVEGGRRIEVLRGLDLEVFTGERVAVIGESGVGKSTLLHILGGLERPTGGQVLHQGRDIFRLEGEDLARFRNREVGFVFQFHYLLPDFSALENVMMPALINREDWKTAEERAAILLGEVGLESRKDHRPGTMSGGEQQRVAVARAMIQNPKIILADEPTGNLDPRTATEIQSLFLRVCHAHETTLITATHNLKFAQMMDRCFELTQGNLIEFKSFDISVG
jgi:lipoprotein-releasing system ATP-binding protein